jgi:nucleoside-diphosphate-sugar epimerase
LGDFRRINVFGTVRLAQHAAASGVKRFIFLSSIKVHGEYTEEGFAITESSPFLPKTFYAQSKMEAELALAELLSQSAMELVIIRPPLVYGHGCKGNFLRLSNLSKSSLPLPFGAIKNQRSYVALDNLVDFLLLCADRNQSPNAANQIFVVSDGEDISTSDLLLKIAKASGHPVCLFPFSVGLLKFAMRFLCGQRTIQRIFLNLQINNSKSYDLLGWRPKFTMEQQLKKMFAKGL